MSNGGKGAGGACAGFVAAGASPGLYGMQVSHGDKKDKEWGGELEGRRPGRQPGG